MTVRRLASGVAALGASTLCAQVVGFAVFAVMARRLGPGHLGAFTFATNLVGYFAIPANFGVTALATRDVAREPERAREIMGEVMLVGGILSVIPYVALLVLAPALAVDGTSQAIIPIVALGFVIDVVSLQWMLYGNHRFGPLAYARVVGALIFGVLAIALVHGGGHGAVTLAWVTIAGLLPATALTARAVLRAAGRPRWAWSPRRLWRRFASGAPLGVAAVMITIYYSIDSVMLGYMRDTATVGQYAVAYKIPLAVIAFAALWASVLFPHASALAAEDRGELRAQLDAFGSLSLAGSLPVLAGALLVAHDLIPHLFGAQYHPAVTPFVLLMGAAALIMVTINYGTVAIAVGDERHYAVGVTLAAATNIAANVVLIGPYGMTGAGIATLLAEAVVFLYVFARLWRILGPLSLDAERVARAAAATAAMVAVLLVIRDATALVRVGAGVAVFAACAAALRVLRPHELRALLDRGEDAEPAEDAVLPEDELRL